MSEANGELGVQFDRRHEDKTLPLSVVAEILRMWHERHPEQFGAYLAEAYTGVRPRAGRGRP